MQNYLTSNKKITGCGRAFTFVEIVAAIMLLSIMISTVLVVMNCYIGAVIDMRLRKEAFELARSNMERLLSETSLSDIYEYGESEINPAIEWETIVEPFSEPYKDRMWIRAVCSASFVDSKDKEQTVELEHWITNLTATQIRQILSQQDIEEVYMDLVQNEYTEMQMTTIAFLEQEGLDVEGYKALLENHRRQKLEYLNDKALEGYDDYVQQLMAEENKFLEGLGMDFDKYNDFAAGYTPEVDNKTSTDDSDSQLDDLINEFKNL